MFCLHVSSSTKAVAYVDTLLKQLGFGKSTGIQNKDHQGILQKTHFTQHTLLQRNPISYSCLKNIPKEITTVLLRTVNFFNFSLFFLKISSMSLEGFTLHFYWELGQSSLRFSECLFYSVKFISISTVPVDRRTGKIYSQTT